MVNVYKLDCEIYVDADVEYSTNTEITIKTEEELKMYAGTIHVGDTRILFPNNIDVFDVRKIN